MTAPAAQPLTPGVNFLWPNPIIIGRIPLEGITHPNFAVQELGEGSSRSFQRLDPAHVLAHPDLLAREFLTSFNQLAGAASETAVVQVDLRVEVWRHGHNKPAAAEAARYIGWCVLAAEGGLDPESGAISLIDPRVGSSMTAMPGLPWGRPILVKAERGQHVVTPGWLIHSVVPVERGQHMVVAVATASR